MTRKKKRAALLLLGFVLAFQTGCGASGSNLFSEETASATDVSTSYDMAGGAQEAA